MKINSLERRFQNFNVWISFYKNYSFKTIVYVLKTETEHLQTKISQLEATITKLQQSVVKEKWYDNTDVKRLFNISDSTLSRYRRDKKIPFTKLGNKILYPESFFNQSLKKKMENKHLM